MIGLPVSCGLHRTLFSPRFSLRSLITNTLPGPSVSEVTTLWRYTNLFIVIIIIINFYFLNLGRSSRGGDKN